VLAFTLPATQLVQITVPVFDAYEPAAQEVHAAAPVEYFPAAQLLVQANVEPVLASYLPPAQLEQVGAPVPIM
jgi:hypothetical protein